MWLWLEHYEYQATDHWPATLTGLFPWYGAPLGYSVCKMTVIAVVSRSSWLTWITRDFPLPFGSLFIVENASWFVKLAAHIKGGCLGLCSGMLGLDMWSRYQMDFRLGKHVGRTFKLRNIHELYFSSNVLYANCIQKIKLLFCVSYTPYFTACFGHMRPTGIC
jgi:hypothetical protein